MARDEALMLRVGESESPPTLRLYQWETPTLSLGYFQPFCELESLGEPLQSLPVVRRLTGGGAILHDLELTYSLALPTDHPVAVAGPNRLYELAHDAIIKCLLTMDVVADRGGDTDDSGPRRGPFFCFARRHRYDVLVGSDKLVGSAQRRTRKAILQHGSIILANRYAEQATATVPQPFDRTIRAIRSSFPEQLAIVMGVSFQPGKWTADELAAAQALVPKYAGSEWTRRT